jgi:hypothetical protein
MLKRESEESRVERRVESPESITEEEDEDEAVVDVDFERDRRLNFNLFLSL